MVLFSRPIVLLQMGPDGEEHTARTATNDGAQPEGDQSSSPDTEDDFLNAVLSPLMGIIKDAEQEQRSESKPAAAKPAAPQEAPLAHWQAPKEVTTDANQPGKEAVKVVIDADRLDVSSPEKREVPCSTAPFRAR
jgi:hypothetical protein